MLKKHLFAVLAVLIIVCLMSSCMKKTTMDNTSAASGVAEAEASPRLKVVTTIFPEYDWVREVLGEEFKDVELTLLLDKGVDLHSFQPSAEDILKLYTCDLFLYVGGESDEWVEDALAEVHNSNMKVINLLEVLGDGAKEEELVEGMQGEEEEGEEEGEEEDAEYDEHVWLSLNNAQVFVSTIVEALSDLDVTHAATYRANGEAYNRKLSDLDARYRVSLDDASLNTVLFGDRFPFRYLVDDYDINYYAAFVGCSAESEASFETIAFLSSKLDELKLHTVLVLENSNRKIAETVISNSCDRDRKILALDSMQSVTAKDVAAGATYLSIMESNLEVLAAALK